MLFNIIAALFLFSLLVTVHECGHYFTARALGVNALEFAIGMGPVVLRRQGKNTLFTLRALPLGGFVRLEGEEETDSGPHSFSAAPPYKRFIILVAGGTMNLVLGLLVMFFTLAPLPSAVLPSIGEVLPQSAAEQAGLLPGDRILKINGGRINIYQDVSFHLSKSDMSAPCALLIKRDGERLSLSLSPQFSEESNRYLIGFRPLVVDNTPLLALHDAYFNTFLTMREILSGFVGLITGRVGVDNISGPVGIFSIMGDAVGEATQSGEAGEQGRLNLAFLFFLLSVNLGLFNLLPIPALDGGKIVFVLIEAITRKKIPPEKEGLVHLVGFCLLLALILFATGNDISKIFFSGSGA